MGIKGRSLRRPGLTVGDILAWADAQFAETGVWPRTTSEAVAGVPGETWSAVNAALREGLRGLPGGDTLARLLRRRRAAPEQRGRPGVSRQWATQLRARGLSLAEIGRRLGVSRQAIHQKLQGRLLVAKGPAKRRAQAV
jgi:hypothetical protein